MAADSNQSPEGTPACRRARRRAPWPLGRRLPTGWPSGTSSRQPSTAQPRRNASLPPCRQTVVRCAPFPRNDLDRRLLQSPWFSTRSLGPRVRASAVCYASPPLMLLSQLQPRRLRPMLQQASMINRDAMHDGPATAKPGWPHRRCPAVSSSCATQAWAAGSCSGRCFISRR